MNATAPSWVAWPSDPAVQQRQDEQHKKESRSVLQAGATCCPGSWGLLQQLYNNAADQALNPV